MRDLISTPITPGLRLAVIGNSADELLSALGIAPAPLEEADGAIFLVSARDGVTPDDQTQWSAARELYIPSLVVINDLQGSEIDFDDMAAISGRLLDPVVTPFLVLHSDNGDPLALIDLDTLEIHENSSGQWIARESEAEHKILVLEFRQEFLEAIDAAGDAAFENGLLYPALPFVPDTGLGLLEIREYVNRLPVRS